MKTVKTTQGHLAVIKSRNKAYEVEVSINLLKFNVLLHLYGFIGLSKEMQVAINRLLIHSVGHVNVPILNQFFAATKIECHCLNYPLIHFVIYLYTL